MKRVKPKIIILILFVVAVFTRTFWLNYFPNGITNDELHFILNAKAVFYGFTDMAGVWNPLSLTSIPDNPSAELTSPLLAPFLGPFKLNLFSARLPFAIVSSFLVVVIYLIAVEINPILGLIAGLVTIINPWFFYLGRIAFDQPLATFFLTLGFYLLLKLKNKSLIFSVIPLLLGFFTYIGTKIIFLPFVVLTLLFVWLRNHRRYSRNYLIVFALSFAAVLYFVLTILTGPSRLNELITPFSPQIADTVAIERASSSPTFFSRLFINRFTVYSAFFLKKYLNNFSPDILFNAGDATHLISLSKHGYFYYLDIFFLLLGGYYLLRSHPRFFWTFLGFILLSPVPEAIRADLLPAYAFHSCLQYPYLVIFIAAGLYFFLSRFPRLTLPVITVYILFFINFLYLYFFRYPIYQPDSFSFSTRVLSNYLIHERQTGRRLVVITTEPSNLLRQYLFYSGLYTQANFPIIQDAYRQNRYDLTFDNIRFTNHYSAPLDDPNTVYIAQFSFFRSPFPRLALNQVGSNFEVYSIYNSQLCPRVARTFSNTSLFDFDLSRYSLSDLCQKFISKD